MITRCAWADSGPLEQRYHDKEWGVPLYDDRRLFELLILEGAQAGLSWSIILKKRDGYRRAFDNFDARKIVKYTPQKIARLLADAGIVRNRLKISATIENARAYLALKQDLGFSDYLWQFVGEPRINTWKTKRAVPAHTTESDAMSKALKKRGFKFVGSTICYAFMQATGMVNDHTMDCFRYSELAPWRKKR